LGVDIDQANQALVEVAVLAQHNALLVALVVKAKINKSGNQ
jgi:hypothetical protein